MNRHTILGLALAIVTLSPVTAQEAYRVKVRKDRQVGDAVLATEIEQGTQKTVVKDAQGKVLQERTLTPARNVVFTETILELDGNKATKYSRRYDKAVVTENGQEVEVPVTGKTIIITRKGDGFDFSVQGESEFTGRGRKLLEEAFASRPNEDRFNEIVFGEPLRVGQARMFDASEVIKTLFKRASGLKIDEQKASGTVKLNEVYQKNGVPFGKLTVSLAAPILTAGTAERQIKGEEGSTLSLTLTMDCCIDGSRTEGTMEGNLEIKFVGQVEVGGMKVTLVETVQSKQTDTRKMVAK